MGQLTQRWSIAVLSTIRPVTLDDVVGLGRYEAIRDEFRADIIALKRHRRLAVGEEITFVFENHATVLFQIQEMLRAERITDLDGVREEIEVYNASLPLPGQLSATMLIEITSQDRIAERLQSLLGIDQAVRLQIGNSDGIPGEFESGRSKEDKLSAVQYVRFSLLPAEQERFVDPTFPAWIVIDHPNYRAQAAIVDDVRISLAEDLRQP